MTTKRQFEKVTILNSNNIEQQVKNLFISSMRRVWKFAFDTHGNNRSSAKTDLLHSSIENSIIQAFGDYKDLFLGNFKLIVEKENIDSQKTQRIKHIEDIFGNKFKVDMLITHNDQIHTVFLVKAPLTSINKNRYNSIANTFGEIDRFYGNPENKNIQLVFINITPKKTFTVDEKNGFLKVENVRYLGLNKDDKGNKPMDKLPKSDEIKQKITEIHIEYDINFSKDLSEIKNKNDLKQQILNDENFVNILPNGIDDLKSYVNQFIISNNHIFNVDLESNPDISHNWQQLKLKF